ncbi:uncharacterized protein LOC141913374 [Tubulanus polymorphus]|uniref:uncharacterized protein LOC141913374 n=1 Tax=Tubulanus polymorphus TaxID=672921 RepID=UPI003DA4F228
MEDGRCLIDVISGDPDALSDFFLPDDKQLQQQQRANTNHGNTHYNNTNNCITIMPPTHSAGHQMAPMSRSTGSPMTHGIGSPMIGSPLMPSPCVSPAQQQILQHVPATQANISTNAIRSGSPMVLINQKLAQPQILPKPIGNVVTTTTTGVTPNNIYNAGHLQTNATALRLPNGQIINLNQMANSSGTVTMQPTAGGSPINIQGTIIQTSGGNKYLIQQNQSAGQVAMTTQNNAAAAAILNNGAVHLHNGPVQTMGVNLNSTPNLNFLNFSTQPANSQILIQGAQPVTQQQAQNIILRTIPTSNIGLQMVPSANKTLILGGASAAAQQNILQQSIQLNQPQRNINIVGGGAGHKSIAAQNGNIVMNTTGNNTQTVNNPGLNQHDFRTSVADNNIGVSSSATTMVRTSSTTQSTSVQQQQQQQTQTVQLSSQAQLALQKINTQMKHLLGLKNPTPQQKHLLHQLGEVQRKILDHGRQMASKAVIKKQTQQEQQTQAAQQAAQQVQVMAQHQANQIQTPMSSSCVTLTSTHQSQQQLHLTAQQSTPQQPPPPSRDIARLATAIPNLNLNALNVPNVTVTQSDSKLSSLKPIIMKSTSSSK